MEQSYDLIKLFYKIKKEEKSGVHIGNTEVIEDFISNCYIQRINSLKEQIYCPKCGETRKHEFILKFDNDTSKIPGCISNHKSILNKCKEDENISLDFEEFKDYVYKNLVKIKRTILITGRCLQCDNEVIVIIYNEKDEINMVKLYEYGGGVSTQHTPESIKYYLDEAHKCKTMGAYTGAVAMYRTALENLLYDKGYEKSTLKEKINELEKQKQENRAPRWADVVDEDILDKIRDLGNWAVHPNKGDITKQKHLQDEKLIECLDEIFKYLLDEIYEKEIKRKSLLKTLNKKKNDLNNN